MRIQRHFQSVPDIYRGSVVAIGNFDGIHRGHQAVIDKARRLAQEFGAPLALMTFEPHPRKFFKPDLPPFRLTPFRVKVRLIEALGVDCLFVIPFTREFSSLSAERFMSEVLAGDGETGLGVRHVVVGDNFRFGHKAKGDVALLDEFGRANGFGVTAVSPVTGPQEEVYSSTLVRDYLKAGNPTRAALLLGRYWEIEGRVAHGYRRGRGLGYPTANIELGEILQPAFGVYAVRVAFDRQAGRSDSRTPWYPAIANIGISPMFENPTPTLEAFIFDFDQDIYGEHMRVALVDYLRPEQKFDDLEGLKAQMAKDCDRARATLAWEEWDALWPASPFMSGKTGGEDRG
jgi:riboflavin kinase/FMN adenylyltransferase